MSLKNGYDLSYKSKGGLCRGFVSEAHLWSNEGYRGGVIDDLFLYPHNDFDKST